MWHVIMLQVFFSSYIFKANVMVQVATQQAANPVSNDLIQHWATCRCRTTDKTKIVSIIILFARIAGLWHKIETLFLEKLRLHVLDIVN